jgi:hypothetical protein
MTRFVFQGTGHTVGGGGVIGALVLAAVLLGASGVAAGIAEGVAAAVSALLIILAGLVVIVAALGCLVVWKIRHGGQVVMLSPGGRQALERQAAALHESGRPAIAAPQPMTVNHFHGGNHWHASGDAIRQAIPGQAGDAHGKE